MLEKPDIHDEKIIACLSSEYGLHVGRITFLSLGAGMANGRLPCQHPK